MLNPFKIRQNCSLTPRRLLLPSSRYHGPILQSVASAGHLRCCCCPLHREPALQAPSSVHDSFPRKRRLRHRTARWCYPPGKEGWCCKCHHPPPNLHPPHYRSWPGFPRSYSRWRCPVDAGD